MHNLINFYYYILFCAEKEKYYFVLQLLPFLSTNHGITFLLNIPFYILSNLNFDFLFFDYSIKY